MIVVTQSTHTTADARVVVAMAGHPDSMFASCVYMCTDRCAGHFEHTSHCTNWVWLYRSKCIFHWWIISVALLNNDIIMPIQLL